MFWSLSEHLFDGTPLDHSIYMHRLINLSTALFWNRKDSPAVIKDIQMLYPYLKESNQKLEKFKINKSSTGFKVKNDNGPIKVFIYCSTPRSVCIVRRYIHYTNRANIF